MVQRFLTLDCLRFCASCMKQSTSGACALSRTLCLIGVLLRLRDELHSGILEGESPSDIAPLIQEVTFR